MKLTSLLEASQVLDTKDKVNSFLKGRGKRIASGLNKYSINDDLSVVVDGDVLLSDLTLGKLPIKFKQTRSFKIINARLTTLEGCPDVVVGIFDCSNNLIKDLTGGPKLVHDSYVMNQNPVTSLKGVAEEAHNLMLTECSELTRLDYLPSSIDMLKASNCGLTSLQGIHKIAKKLRQIDISYNPLASHVLGLMKIPGLQYIWFEEYKGTNKTKEEQAAHAIAIMRKHINDKSSIFDCQAELEDAGLDEYAQL